VTFVKKYAHYNESNVNIGVRGIPSGLIGKEYFKGQMTKQQMLRYKYLLSLEGNDVATNLKWNLASSSVVFMPKPTAETYAMEGLLVPYVHYIPVNNDGSDLEEKLQWARENDATCKWISEQATEYMDKLWLSDRAREDNIVIRNELANLYHEQFGKALHECYKRRTSIVD